MRVRWIVILAVLAVCLAGCNVGRGPIGFTPDRLPDGHTGQSYEAIIQVTNNQTPVGDIYISSGALPDGMTLEFTRGSATSATLTGTPTVAGTYVFTVSAWCLGTNVSGQSGEQNYSLVVS